MDEPTSRQAAVSTCSCPHHAATPTIAVHLISEAKETVSHMTCARPADHRPSTESSICRVSGLLDNIRPNRDLGELDDRSDIASPRRVDHWHCAKSLPLAGLATNLASYLTFGCAQYERYLKSSGCRPVFRTPGPQAAKPSTRFLGLHTPQRIDRALAFVPSARNRIHRVHS